MTPEGDIYPCHQFVGQPQFRMGSVHDEPIALNACLTADFAELMVPNKPACMSCWSRYFCSGGCAANAYAATGSVLGLYEIGCALQKKRLECALWIKSRLMQDAQDL